MLRGAALIAAAAVLLPVAGFVRYAVLPPADNRPAATDAIVVLTGGSLRLQSGIDLMRVGKGHALFVSGVAREVGLDDLLRAAGGDAPRWIACCIALGHEADNTFENAQETARWMRRRGYHSLRLVTAWYHTPRGLLEFERAMPDVEIVPHPVFPVVVKDQHWWASRGTATLLIGEYGKYLAAMLLTPFVRSLIGSMAPVATEARR